MIQNITSQSKDKTQAVYIYITTLVILIGKTGFWFMPNLIEQFEISQSLTKLNARVPAGEYLYSNYLEPALFGLSGANSPQLYFLYATLVTVCFLLLFIRWFHVYHGDDIAIKNLGLPVAVLFSAVFVPVYWIGMDGMTLLLILLIMMADRPYLYFSLAILLAWQHFEQGMFAFGILLISLLPNLISKNRNESTSGMALKAVLIIIGLTIGRLVLALYFDLIGIHFSVDRVDWMQRSLLSSAAKWQSSWLYILWSLYGAGWFFIILKFNKQLIPLIFTTLIALFLLIIVDDQTRVGAIILFPSLFYWVLKDKQLWHDISYKQSLGLLIAYFAIPLIYVWRGHPYGSLWQYDAQLDIGLAISAAKLYNFNWLLPF